MERKRSVEEEDQEDCRLRKRWRVEYNETSDGEDEEEEEEENRKTWKTEGIRKSLVEYVSLILWHKYTFIIFYYGDIVIIIVVVMFFPKFRVFACNLWNHRGRP